MSKRRVKKTVKAPESAEAKLPEKQSGGRGDHGKAVFEGVSLNRKVAGRKREGVSREHQPVVVKETPWGVSEFKTPAVSSDLTTPVPPPGGSLRGREAVSHSGSGSSQYALPAYGKGRAVPAGRSLLGAPELAPPKRDVTKRQKVHDRHNPHKRSRVGKGGLPHSGLKSEYKNGGGGSGGR